MKKYLLFLAVSIILLAPQLSLAAVVECGNDGQAPCTLGDLFIAINNVYENLLLLATPLAVLMIMVGGVVILISAGNPRLAGTGKNILKWSIIGLLLIWGAYLIIDTLMSALGYRGGPWFSSPF